MPCGPLSPFDPLSPVGPGAPDLPGSPCSPGWPLGPDIPISPGIPRQKTLLYLNVTVSQIRFKLNQSSNGVTSSGNQE